MFCIRRSEIFRAAGISRLYQWGDQSRQPTNQVITFPQISAILASTSRPMRTLRAMTAWE